MANYKVGTYFNVGINILKIIYLSISYYITIVS